MTINNKCNTLKQEIQNTIANKMKGCIIIMKKYVCSVCGYVYDPAEGDPDNNIAAGTSFEALPEDWICPVCSVGKSEFAPE